MMETAPQTRSDWVYERLKHAIVSGALPPGTRLVAAELAQRWALSPTPLREAFQRLEGLGIVNLFALMQGQAVSSLLYSVRRPGLGP
jgi:DNA-binding GntR family transcriptional regulator